MRKILISIIILIFLCVNLWTGFYWYLETCLDYLRCASEEMETLKDYHEHFFNQFALLRLIILVVPTNLVQVPFLFLIYRIVCKFLVKIK